MTHLEDVPLTGMDHYGIDNQQWRLNRICLTNWGGFDGGPHVLDVAASATLIAGATGVGKSSILDAWTAVLQPPRSGTLNTASNDAGGRTVQTYLQGQHDQKTTGDVVTAIELRPGPQVGMVALEFSSTSGAWCTVGRFLRSEMPPRKGLDDRWFLTRSRMPASFSPELYKTTFSQNRLADVWPGLELFVHWPKFAAVAMPLLGIGRENFRQPLALLRDIQAGKSLNSVTELFRHSVLDKPTTYVRADTALKEFDEIIDVHHRLAQDARKLAQLRPLRDRLVEFRTAQRSSDQLDGYVSAAFQASDGGGTAFDLWEASRKVGFLDVREDDLAASVRLYETQHAAIDEQTQALGQDVESLSQEWRAKGGDRLALLENDFHEAEEKVRRVQQRRLTLEADRLKIVRPLPRSAVEWHELVEGLRSQTSEARREEMTAALVDARGRFTQAEKDVARLRQQIDDVEKAGNNISSELREDRNKLAAAAGLSATDLPFVGELLDLAPGQEQWRIAANAVGGSFACVVLVPADQRIAFSTAIDSVAIAHRLRFRYVSQDLPVDSLDEVTDPATLAGKLMVDQGSRFAGWLTNELEAVFPHLCVDQAADLGSDNIARVTRSGQERRANRGAHGGGQRNILGFTSETTLAMLRTDLHDAEIELDSARQAAQQADRERSLFEQFKTAADVAQVHDWNDLDLVGAVQRRDQLGHELQTLRASDDLLAELRQQIEDKRKHRDALLGQRGVVANELKNATAEVEKCRILKDRVLDRQQELLTRHGLDLSAEQESYLDARLADIGSNPDTFEQLTKDVAQLKGLLAREREEAQRNQATAQRGAEQLMEIFLSTWPDYRHKLAATIDAGEQFTALLTELEDAGLEDQRLVWAENVQDWTSSHLGNLLQEFDTADYAITERLAPVRSLLSNIAYGADGDRLDVHVRRKPSAQATAFRGDLVSALNGLMPTSYSADDDLVAEVEQRITRLEKVLEHIRPESSTRDRILDVRLHHEFSARRMHPVTGAEIAYYPSVAGKSGGEGQELLAFITGAALRCRLGDEDNNRPTFAPIVLDEAFIKADSQTAPRALRALSSLGFQPIVVAPEGVFTALEPLFSQISVILKHDDRSHIVGLADVPAEQRDKLDTTAIQTAIL